MSFLVTTQDLCFLFVIGFWVLYAAAVIGKMMWKHLVCRVRGHVYDKPDHLRCSRCETVPPEKR